LCLCASVYGALVNDPGGGITTSVVRATTNAPAAIEVSSATPELVSFPPTWTPAPITPTELVQQVTPTRIIMTFLTTTPTEIIVLPPPVRADYGPLLDVCDCSDDIYNCSDFNNQVAAQYCFSYCQKQKKGDVHNLDGDNDGRACE